MNLKLFFSIAACSLLMAGAQLSAQNNNSNIPAEYATKIQAEQQLTNLPTVYLTVPDAIGQDINSVLTKTGTVAEYHKATIKVVDKTGQLSEFTDDKLEIKVRGNSTAADSKKPYRLKFGKDKKDAEGNVIETHKHDMLGQGYSKRNWTLLTNHKDGSLLRNALTYHVGQAVGMDFCPGYRFVDLVINGEYRGNYMLSDHCEVGKHRIDVDEETGWFIEAARGDMVEEPLVEAAGLRMSIKNPEPADEAATDALKAEVKDYFNRLNRYWGIYSTPCSDEEFQNPKTGWRAYIDEESLAKFYIGINLTDDYDGFMTVKMYREADGKLQFGPLWDKDLAYGNWDNHGKLCEEYQTGYTFCDHMARMMTDPYFVRTVHDKLHEIVDGGFVAQMQAKVIELCQMLTESQALNQKLWWTAADYPAKTKELSDYVAEHTAYVVSEIDAMYKAMGCATLPEQQVGGEGGSDEDGSGEESGSTGPYETTLAQWNNTPIPASAFNKKATAAKIEVVGAAFVRLLNSDNENDIIQAAEWNNANITGVTFDIDGEVLAKGKAGNLFIRVGGGTEISMTITCTVPEEGEGDSEEGGEGEGGHTHSYDSETFVQVEDGTYRHVCTECGEAETEGEVYYRFDVYAESKTAETTYTTDAAWASKQDVSEKPNTLFVTDAAGIEGRNVVSAGICQELVITDGHPFFNKALKFQAVKATYTRTLDAATEWGTVCLPFKVMSDDQVIYYELTDVSGEGEEHTMTFGPATSTGGGTPLAFRKVNSAATEVTMTGAAQESGYITVKTTDGMEKNLSKKVPEGWNFYGNLQKPQELSAETNPEMYYIANNKFWHATGTLTINPFRAYFSGPTEVRAARFRIATDDATGIEEVSDDATTNATTLLYDLGGRRVNDKTAKVELLLITPKTK